MARVCPDNIDSIKLFRKHGLWQNFRNRLFGLKPNQIEPYFASTTEVVGYC
jgi:hypothetical protein